MSETTTVPVEAANLFDRAVRQCRQNIWDALVKHDRSLEESLVAVNEPRSLWELNRDGDIVKVYTKHFQDQRRWEKGSTFDQCHEHARQEVHKISAEVMDGYNRWEFVRAEIRRIATAEGISREVRDAAFMLTRTKSILLPSVT